MEEKKKDEQSKMRKTEKEMALERQIGGMESEIDERIEGTNPGMENDMNRINEQVN